MLYDPARHVPTTDDPWCGDIALEALQSIFKDVCGRLENVGLWPALPEEESKFRFEKALYSGAAGTIWGLEVISRRLNEQLPFDPVEVSDRAYAMYYQEPDTGSVAPSLLLGETGLLLLKQKLSPSETTLAKLRDCIRANMRNPVNEALWGSPGTMLAALRIGQSELYQQSANYLYEQWTEASEGIWIWHQDLYGKRSKYIGAGHGFFGNAHALLEGKEYLSESQRKLLYERIVETAFVSARRENGMANWMPGFFMEDPRAPLTQWCHGAPGVVTSLRSFPKNHSEEMEQLLTEAGELIWTAGPLAKGIGICHGTDGNGFALLRLFDRTEDELWLDRARRFAMHALSQRNGRSTLWTGEVGLALFLIACIDQQPDFPVLDYF